MIKVQEGLKYTNSHEWVRVEGQNAYIGVTDYAQHHLGDIVFVELPVPGDKVAKGEVISVVESVKAASDVYAPVSGTIMEINEELSDSPGMINEDAYEAWIAMVKLENDVELEELMDDADYETICKEG